MVDHKDSLLTQYTRQIVFLRGQLQKARLKLVLGAGISIPIGFPSWAALVNRIAREIGSEDLIEGKVEKFSLTAKVQYLQNVFVKKERERKDFYNEKYEDEQCQARWREVLQKSLYKGVKTPEEHPYLRSLIDLVKSSKFIVNYNFDDSIEKLVAGLFPDDLRKGKRPYDTTWSLASPLRDDVLTIYHPNGYIPSHKHEYPSDRIVFSDETFSDQMIGEQVGNHSLIHHFLQNTFLLVGLSLDDVSLRQHLRRMALMAPGLNHVLIFHEETKGAYSESQKQAIEKANFEVYNLLTMFLTAEEVKDLIDILSESPVEFSERGARLGLSLKFTYYITGGVGAGKTTSVNQFGSCNYYDEWVEPSPDVVSKPFTALTSQEKYEADRWIERQFMLKNRALRHCTEGIHIVDRCPLDPLSFEDENLSQRAGQLISSIRPGLSDTKLEAGQLILLECSAEELQRRLISKNKYWSAETIAKNVKRLRSLYDSSKFVAIDTYDNDVGQMSKLIARLIFMADYMPYDLDALLMDKAGK